MAATSIGPLTLKIMANADAMTGTLNAVSKQVSSFSAKTAMAFKGAGTFAGPAKLIKDLGTFAGDAFANPMRAANDMLLGGAAAIAGTIPFVGAAIALPLRAVQAGIGMGLDAFDAASKNIAAIGKGALKTGMSAADFQLFSIMADGADKAERSMFKFAQKLATVETAVVGSRTVFDSLGMDGRKIADLYGKDAPAALGLVGDRLREIGNPALQAHALMELFGKSGAELAPMLLKGSKGIEEMRAKIDKFGLGIDDGLVGSVKEVAKASKDVKMLWEGFSNQLVVGLAPIMRVIAERIGSMPLGFKGMGDAIRNVIASVILFGARAWDWLTETDFETKWTDFVELIKTTGKEVIDWLGDRIDDMIGAKQEKWARFGDGLVGGGLGGKMADAIADIVEQQRKALAAMPGDLDLDWEDMDWGGWEKMWEKETGKALGSAKKLVEDMNKTFSGIGREGADPLAHLRESINHIKDSTKGPLGQFADQMGQIQRVVSAIDAQRKAAEDREEFERLGLQGPQLPGGGPSAAFDDMLTKRQKGLAAFKAAEGLLGAMPEKRFAGAAMRDSTEAYSAIVQHQFGDQNKSIQERMIEAIKEQTAIQETQARAGLDLLDFVRENPGALTVGGV